MPLHAKYKANLAAAIGFEEFVSDTLMHERKIIACVYRSRHYQTMHGESVTGVEVKLDMKFRDSGRLFIETAERHHEFAEERPSGPYHDSAPWLMAIGDYSTFWLFGTSTLRNIYESGNCEERTTNTSRGFLLPLDKADRHAIYKWEA